MTRDERATEREQRLKREIEAKQMDLARAQAAIREAARKRQNQRRFQVGKLAEEAGLCGWDDATLTGLFAVLARLAHVTEPVKVLNGLVLEVEVEDTICKTMISKF